MKSLLAMMLLAKVALVGNVVYQPPTTPEFEENLVYNQSKKPVAPLSEGLKDLIAGVIDKTFNEAFFKKIQDKEKEKFTGEYVDYWENGQPKIKANFIDGKVDGHVHGWFPDGLEAFKAFYYENKKVGIHMVFYPEVAKKVQEANARILTFDFNGKLDNEQESEYHNGRLKTMIRYRHGTLHGHMAFYDSNQTCIRDRDYESGKLVKAKIN